jgi:hypothetical protein
MKTYTPELDPIVLARLVDYAGLFQDDFRRWDQGRWTGIYLQGLLRDGERKSIEPLAGRVVIPADWQIAARRATGETLEAIGERFGLTRERVRQIVAAGEPGRRA